MHCRFARPSPHRGHVEESVRYAYVFGVLGTQPQISLTPIAKSGLFWDPATLSRATKVFETAWNALLGDLHGDTEVSVPELRVQMLARLSSGQAREVLQKLPLPPFFDPSTCADALIRKAIDAFFDQGLLAASRQLLAGAIGSFGLVLSFLDADDELVFASRGQTMSIAFYPESGMILFCSEPAATKAGMESLKPRWWEQINLRAKSKRNTGTKLEVETQPSLRLDMDAVNGEVLQLRWGATSKTATSAERAD